MNAAASGSGVATAAPDSDVRRFSDFFAPATVAHPRLVEGGLYLLALVLGWMFRFIEDDAFITYRYSQNLAEGHGLVLNPGERVEGYTNFLWTVIHAIPERLGWTTPRFSEILGLVIFVATVAVALRLARAIVGNEAGAVFAVLVLLANMSFVGYGTSGLETMLQTLLVTSMGLVLMAGVPHPRLGPGARRILAGVLGGIALLVRLDTAVLIATWFLLSVIGEWRSTQEAGRDGRTRRLVVGSLQLGLPLLVIVVPWLVWKYDYYGSLLPNTFTAKTGSSVIQPYLYGIFYLLGFLAWYGAFLLIGRWRRHRRSLFALPGVHQAAVVVGVWCLYIVAVGADFMEFRFLVPVLPLLAIAAAHLIDRYRSFAKEIALVAVLGLFSFSHTQVRNWAFPVFTFKDLSHWPAEYAGSWHSMGLLLRDAFPGGIERPGQPLIAVVPLGVIPYYSELPSIDMLGLADKTVAREGLVGPVYYPGHVRMAPLPYLVERAANLVVGQPLIDELEPGRTEFRTGELIAVYPVVDLKDLPDDAQVIQIPLSDDKVWPIIYLEQNDLVDAAIEREGWKVFPIVEACEDGDVNFAAKLVGTDTCPT